MLVITTQGLDAAIPRSFLLLITPPSSVLVAAIPRPFRAAIDSERDRNTDYSDC